MKHPILYALPFVSLMGCSTIDIEGVADGALSGALDGAINSVSIPRSSSNSSGSSGPHYQKQGSDSVKKERINILSASRTSKAYGKVEVMKVSKNPEGQTKVLLEGCSHPRIGNLRCGGYVFEVTEEGWLVEKPIAFNDSHAAEVVLPAGKYYLKFSNPQSGSNRFAAADFSIQAFKTNHVFVELE